MNALKKHTKEYLSHLSRSNKGFTLLEVLISVVILSVIITPILAVFTSAFQATVVAQDIVDGTYISQRVYENLVSDDLLSLINVSPTRSAYDSDGDGTNDCFVQINLYPDGGYASLSSPVTPCYLHINYIESQIILFGASGTSSTPSFGTKTAPIGNVTLVNSNSSDTVTVYVDGASSMSFDKPSATSPLIIVNNLHHKTIGSPIVTLTLTGDTTNLHVVELARGTNHEELVCTQLLETNTYFGVNDFTTTLVHANIQVFDINDSTRRIGFMEGTFEALLN